jgi:hypothetical protein
VPGWLIRPRLGMSRKVSVNLAIGPLVGDAECGGCAWRLIWGGNRKNDDDDEDE